MAITSVLCIHSLIIYSYLLIRAFHHNNFCILACNYTWHIQKLAVVTTKLKCFANVYYNKARNESAHIFACLLVLGTS